MAPHDHHRSRAKAHLKIGVITASDTRTADTDESGSLIRKMLSDAGHEIVHYEILRDEPAMIRESIRSNAKLCDAIVINGGTGISPRDSTFEAVRGLLDKELEGFGELFRMLSYQEIGSAAFLTRATAGVHAGKIVVSIPGSTAACKLALEKLLIPELGHMAHLLGL